MGKETIKYATVVFRYKDNSDDINPTAAKLMDYVTNAILNYNVNGAKGGCSRIDLYGFYIDTEDMDIETQNKANEECKESIINSKLKRQ